MTHARSSIKLDSRAIDGNASLFKRLAQRRLDVGFARIDVAWTVSARDEAYAPFGKPYMPLSILTIKTWPLPTQTRPQLNSVASAMSAAPSAG